MDSILSDRFLNLHDYEELYEPTGSSTRKGASPAVGTNPRSAGSALSTEARANGRASKNGDWSMDELPATPGASSTKPAPSTTDKVIEPSTTQTKRGDWTIEEVPANSGDAPQAVPKKPIKESPKGTVEGDWSLEEVEATTSDKK